MFILISEKIERYPGFRLHLLPTQKFQTITCYFRFIHPLEKQEIHYAQILPFVLLQGSQKFPNKNAIQKELDRLSGALLSAQVTKRADKQIISFCLEMLNPKWAADSAHMQEDAFALLEDILFAPFLIENQLSSNLIALEKEKAIARLKGQKDDKIQCANEKLIENLYENLPYGLSIYGTEEGLQAVTSESLTAYYQTFFHTQQIEVYLLGDFESEQMSHCFMKYFAKHFQNGKEFQPFQKKNWQLDHPKEMVQTEPIAQAKLHLGFETDATFARNDYEAMQVCNGIFGAFTHSKCFLTVREKYSLAYYITSKLESQHGFLTVMTGIDAKNESKTREMILKALDQIQNGQVTEKELKQTKAALRNELLCALDDPRGILELSLHQILSGKKRTFHEWLENLSQVTKEDVVCVSRQVKYIGSFFLKGEES